MTTLSIKFQNNLELDRKQNNLEAVTAISRKLFYLAKATVRYAWSCVTLPALPIITTALMIIIIRVLT
jgi:hypothetical protein